MELHRELLQVRCSISLPSVISLLGVAVAFGEREKTAPKRMPDELQQDEQIARPVGQRRAGQEIHGRLLLRDLRRPAGELARDLAPRARVILQVVRFIEDETRPRHRADRVGQA